MPRPKLTPEERKASALRQAEKKKAYNEKQKVIRKEAKAKKLKEQKNAEADDMLALLTAKMPKMSRIISKSTVSLGEAGASQSLPATQETVCSDSDWTYFVFML